MNSATENIALILDFDDTLAPDSTSALLEDHDITPDDFWLKDVKRLVVSGYDPTLAYLQSILRYIGSGKPLGNLSNRDLREFGNRMNKRVYPHLPTFFKDLRRITESYENINIDFFIVSGGLAEIIRGVKVINENFKAVYACELSGDTSSGPLKYIKRAVTFTEKTRYLFEINKGIAPRESASNPYLVNRNVDLAKRPIPFQNMIFVGDGLTDIPCFSLVNHFQGTTFGVFNPKEEKSAKQALQELLKTGRVVSAHAPKYRKNDELGALLRSAVATICSKIGLKREEAK
ncbi:MAG: hypothetical protein ACREBU_02975 [Nitrososphaera sp.]